MATCHICQGWPGVQRWRARAPLQCFLTCWENGPVEGVFFSISSWKWGFSIAIFVYRTVDPTISPPTSPNIPEPKRKPQIHAWPTKRRVLSLQWPKALHDTGGFLKWKIGNEATNPPKRSVRKRWQKVNFAPVRKLVYPKRLLLQIYHLWIVSGKVTAMHCGPFWMFTSFTPPSTGPAWSTRHMFQHCGSSQWQASSKAYTLSPSRWWGVSHLILKAHGAWCSWDSFHELYILSLYHIFNLPRSKTIKPTVKEIRFGSWLLL